MFVSCTVAGGKNKVMGKVILHTKEFEIDGIIIPELKLVSGSLVRMYVPNFDIELNKPLGLEFVKRIMKHLKHQNPELLWMKWPKLNNILKMFSPISTGIFLEKKMGIDLKDVKRIAEELKINIDRSFGDLAFAEAKALLVKVSFVKSDSILMDYYGIGAMKIGVIEKVMNDEINKGKSAIVFDRFEYMEKDEPYSNIKRIVLSA